VVAAEQAKHLAERAQRKALRKAHKACKKTFKAAAKRCGLDSEDESDDETDKQQASSCISTARATKNQCHRDAEKMMASHIKPVVAISTDTDTDTEPSATVTYRHQIVTSPGDHCLEITIPGGDDSPFWKAEGWKYSAPDRPEWVSGQCDKTKWKSQDAKTDGYDGYTAAKNSPYDAVFLIKYGVEADLMPWLRVNPTLQASSLQAQDTSSAPETPVKNKAVMRAEKRAAHEAREYEVHQDDQALLFALVGMLVVVLFGVVYMALKRRRQRSYALEAMHMSVVQSDAAAVKQESAHDQL